MRQPSFLRPRPLTCPATSPKLFFSSSTLLLSVTLSVPALSSGLFTSGHHTFPWLSSRLGSRRPFSSRKASTSLQSVALTWATARRPAWRMVSPMRYLFRRARLSEVPLVLRCSASLRASANSTAVSVPGKTATTLPLVFCLSSSPSVFSHMAWTVVASSGCAMTEAKLISKPAGMKLSRKAMSLSFPLYTHTQSKPAWHTFCATTAPVENGSTMMTQLLSPGRDGSGLGMLASWSR
mmetsp:Transcript_11108/g.41490  ORF Transcript_11108/g.41490 Transcript_11108/m.41490 type:complete len:237 (-) Transcript_11108:1787-2497(-)